MVPVGGEVVVVEKQLMVVDVVEEGHCNLFVGFRLKLGVDHLEIVGGFGINTSLMPVEFVGIGILLIRDGCSHGGVVVGGFGWVWGVVWSGLHRMLILWHFRGGPHHQKNRGMRALRTIRQPTRGGDVASQLWFALGYYTVTWGKGCCNRFRWVSIVQATVSFGFFCLFSVHLPITFGIQIPRGKNLDQH